MNLLAAVFNSACALIWLAQADVSGFAMSAFGVWCSIVAYRWSRS